MSDTAGPRSTPGLQGLSILLVEDETVIALLMKEMLGEFGCGVTHAASIETALAALDARRFDAAVLDFDLDGEPADPVADALDTAGIPFTFTTGYSSERLPARWAARPVLQKPFGADALARGLVRALAYARIAAHVSRARPHQS